MAKVRSVARFILRSSVRASVSAAGFALLVVGAVLLVTPGPGLVVIIAGLAVLATQYSWADRALRSARERASAARERAAAAGLSRRRPPTRT